jgi:hypothetical protein
MFRELAVPEKRLQMRFASSYAVLPIVTQLVQRAPRLITMNTTTYTETNGMECSWPEIQSLSPQAN